MLSAEPGALPTAEPGTLQTAGQARCGSRRGPRGTTRDRQLVAIAAAHLDVNEELLDALVRDHLAAPARSLTPARG